MDRNQSPETKGRFGDRSGNTGILGASKRPGNDKSPDTVGGFYLCGSEIDMRSDALVGMVSYALARHGRHHTTTYMYMSNLGSPETASETNSQVFDYV